MLENERVTSRGDKPFSEVIDVIIEKNKLINRIK